jgi:hypothetical protein
METLDGTTSSADLERQPDSVARVLKRFLKGDWEADENSNEEEDFLADKILLEFPVFSMNEDYIRALANIVMMKLDSARNLLGHKEREIAIKIEERDRQRELRDKSLALLKSKIGGSSNENGRGRERQMTPCSLDRGPRTHSKSKKEQIETWIAKQQLRKNQGRLIESLSGLL